MDTVLARTRFHALAVATVLTALGATTIHPARLAAAPPHRDPVIEWNGLAVDIMKAESTHPPKVGRDLALMHSAIWDAVAAIDGGYYPILTDLPKAPDASIAAAVCTAARDSLAWLYPTRAAEIHSYSIAGLNAIADGPAKAAGIALGQSAALGAIQARQNDGWDGTSTYATTAAPGHWRPTPPGYAGPLAAQWGAVVPFAVTSLADRVPEPPPALNTPAYTSAWTEVKDLGGTVSSIRTDDQAQIAEFWNDFPGHTAAPPGKWNLIAGILADQQGNDTIANARLYALLNVALADGGITCWRAKYNYDLWRPEDAIRLADEDGNDDTTADTTWQPLWPSPPFPAYSSGHSTFSGAGSKVLELFFGRDDIAFSCEAGWDVLPGVLRHYDSLSQAAEEAGMSRIYGGIHFQFDNQAGLSCGREIGAFVYDNVAGAIPEPATMLLLAAGAGVLTLRRRNRRHP